MKKLLSVFLFVPSLALASPCDEFYPNEKEIVIPDTVVLCNSFFAIVYDDNNNANIFSTEVAQARETKVPRKNNFHGDDRIADTPRPDDYTKSGYDRGHMVAAANADEEHEMTDTFLMTNMTPQLPSVNRVAWRLLEDHVRDLDFKWIITGAHYPESPELIGDAKVPVPDFLYKVVYMNDGSIISYIVDNTIAQSQTEEISLADLEAKLGYKLQ